MLECLTWLSQLCRSSNDIIKQISHTELLALPMVRLLLGEFAAVVCVSVCVLCVCVCVCCVWNMQRARGVKCVLCVSWNRRGVVCCVSWNRSGVACCLSSLQVNKHYPLNPIDTRKNNQVLLGCGMYCTCVPGCCQDRNEMVEEKGVHEVTCGSGAGCAQRDLWLWWVGNVHASCDPLWMG